MPTVDYSWRNISFSIVIEQQIVPIGWARSHYEKVIGYLDAAAGRDQVLAWDARKWDLEIGEKMLWATRAENLKRSIP